VVTVNVNVVVCVPDVAVPVTVTGYVPAGVDADVAIVNVDEPPAVTDVGLNDALAPDGNPDAENATDCAEPDVTAVFTVVEPDWPALTMADVGDTDTEKSSLGGGGLEPSTVTSSYVVSVASPGLFSS
jgi:hypothetical protein